MSQAASSSTVTAAAASLEVNGWELAAHAGPSEGDRLSLEAPSRPSALVAHSAMHDVVPGQPLLLHLSSAGVRTSKYAVELACGLSGRRTTRLALDLDAQPDEASSPGSTPSSSSSACGSASAGLVVGRAEEVGLGEARSWCVRSCAT